jgi:cyanophycin synthetase
MTPGRMNLLRVGDARVLVDYAHNAAAVGGLMQMVRDIPARRRIGVIGAPGDRRDEDIRGVGELCGGLDFVIVKEDYDLRGRAPGETAGLVIEGLRAAGLRGDQIEQVEHEPEAVTRAIDMIGEGDLVVVLADDVPGVIAQLRPQTTGTGL